MILALPCADARKNNPTRLEACGESQVLHEVANLLIVAGNPDDICDLEKLAKTVRGRKGTAFEVSKRIRG